MLNWSDKLLDRVETALDRSGWLGKTADAVLARLLPNETALASDCTPCWCVSCTTQIGYWCAPEPGQGCTEYRHELCPSGIPC